MAISNKLRNVSGISLFTILAGWVWARSVLGDYIWAIFLRIPLLNLLPEIAFGILTGVVVCIALPYIVRRVKVADVILYVTIAMTYLMTMEYVPKNRVALEEYAGSFLLAALPMYFVGLSFNYTNQQQKVFLWLSRISIVAMLLYKFIFGLGSIAQGEEDMVAAYNILPHVLLVSMSALDKGKIKDGIFALTGLFMVISFGTRGPIVCIVAFFVLYFLMTKEWKHPLRAKAAIVIAGIVLLVFMEPILIQMEQLFSNLGVSTRIMQRMLDGSFLDSWGRESVNAQIIPWILQHPWTGLGFAGDRLIVGGYSHNLIFELCVSFGIPIAVLVMACILAAVFYGLHYAETSLTKSFIILLVCCSIVHLMISGTYLSHRLLFFLMGYCVSIIRRHTILRRKRNACVMAQ